MYWALVTSNLPIRSPPYTISRNRGAHERVAQAGLIRNTRCSVSCNGRKPQLIWSDRCQASSFRWEGVDGTRSLRRRVTLISAGCLGQSRMTVLRREGTLSRAARREG